MHLFNPVPVLKLVEFVRSLLTADATVERARTFVEEDLGKNAIDCQDRAGFVVNALLVPFILSAIPDALVRLQHRRGHRPGLRAWRSAPAGPARPGRTCPLLNRMVEAAPLGRKTGRGYHYYD